MLLMFCAVHILEGNVITPLLERKIVTLPPALTLCVQLLMASVTGAIGVGLAAPLTAVALGIAQAFLPSESHPGDAPSDKTEHVTPEHATGFTPPDRPERAIHRII